MLFRSAFPLHKAVRVLGQTLPYPKFAIGGPAAGHPLMCTAATVSIAQVRQIVAPGGIDPEHVITPGIFVQGVVQVENPAQEEVLNRAKAVYPEVSA